MPGFKYHRGWRPAAWELAFACAVVAALTFLFCKG
jgi:hypothetical protein